MSSNQVILEKDICEHLILVFVAIMSDSLLKQEFKFLLNEIQSLISNDIVLLDGGVSTLVPMETIKI